MEIMGPIEVLDSARQRCMYGDDYVEGQPHHFICESWAGTAVLDSAANHLEYGQRLRGRCSTAEIATNYIERPSC